MLNCCKTLYPFQDNTNATMYICLGEVYPDTLPHYLCRRTASALLRSAAGNRHTCRCAFTSGFAGFLLERSNWWCSRPRNRSTGSWPCHLQLHQEVWYCKTKNKAPKSKYWELVKKLVEIKQKIKRISKVVEFEFVLNLITPSFPGHTLAKLGHVQLGDKLKGKNLAS